MRRRGVVLVMTATVMAVLMAATAITAGSGVAGASAAPAPTGVAAAGTGACSRIEAQIARAPAIEQRIQERLDELHARLDAVRDPARRARLAAVVQPRIERLERLSEQLTVRVAAARRLCANRTT